MKGLCLCEENGLEGSRGAGEASWEAAAGSTPAGPGLKRGQGA